MPLRGSIWQLTVPVFVVGVAFIFIGESDAVPLRHFAKEFLLAFGEALVIAAILGATVDRYAKQRLTRDVSRDVGVALFGIEAPSSYVSQLHDALSAKTIYFRMDWSMELVWLQEELLAISIRMEMFGQNIGVNPVVPHPAWLMTSVPGHESRFLRYSARTFRAADGREQELGRIEFNEQRLAPPYSTESSGAMSFSVSALDPAWTVPSRALVLADLEGYVVRYARDVVPLIPYGPALRQTLTFSGSALKDLDLSVRVGAVVHRGTPTGEDDGSIRYSVDSLTLPGQTMIVSWERRAQS